MDENGDTMNWAAALGGGALIGGAAAVLLLCNGRIAGISGITAGMFSLNRHESLWRIAFVTGLVVGGLLMSRLVPDAFGPSVITGTPVVVAAGLLVGVGTRLANGCTSGHGVCGIARWSPRSLAATGTFMAVGVLTVFAVRHLFSAGA